MAGHSKWSKIKHKKGVADAKRGKLFSKLSQQIIVAARDGGGDPDANFSLRLLIDKAKAASMPADNIERAIARGTGDADGGAQLESPIYEGFGPDGVSVIVQVLTDNKNRTVSDLRGIFSDAGGNLAESGAVSWNFKQRGVVTVRTAKLEASQKFGEEPKEVEETVDEVTLALMEVPGVEDIQEGVDEDDDSPEVNKKVLYLYTAPKDLGMVRDKVKDTGYVLRSADLTWVPNNYKEADEVDAEKVANFLETLEDYDDVQEIWSDIDFGE